MPFKDTKDGQTHYYGDGCGCPEHNKPKEQENDKGWEEKIREILAVYFDGGLGRGSSPEVVRCAKRIVEELEKARDEERERIVEEIEKLNIEYPEFCENHGNQFKKCCACVLQDLINKIRGIKKVL
jgi:hypothetical protein